MSEQKPPRSLSEIHREYTQLCARAGDIQYKVSQMTKDLNVLNSQLQDLNLEAMRASQAEEKAKAEAANNVTPITQEQSNG